eukprot:304852-Lingulodinium_polyedra.AAC.1
MGALMQNLRQFTNWPRPRCTKVPLQLHNSFWAAMAVGPQATMSKRVTRTPQRRGRDRLAAFLAE